MSHTQSPSRQSQRAPSRTSHRSLQYIAPVSQYPHVYPGTSTGHNAHALSPGPVQVNPFEQQSAYPQGQPGGPALPSSQAGYPVASGPFSTPTMGQVAASSGLPKSPRYPTTSYPHPGYNPGPSPHAPSERSFNRQPHSTFSPGDPPAQFQGVTERPRSVSAVTPRARPAADISGRVIEVFSPETSRPQRHQRDREASVPRRSRHRHESRQTLVLSSGARSTPPAQYYGPVGTSSVNVYHMYKPTFVIQPKQEHKAEPEAAKERKGLLARVFKSNSKK